MSSKFIGVGLNQQGLTYSFWAHSFILRGLKLEQVWSLMKKKRYDPFFEPIYPWKIPGCSLWPGQGGSETQEVLTVCKEVSMLQTMCKLNLKPYPYNPIPIPSALGLSFLDITMKRSIMQPSSSCKSRYFRLGEINEIHCSWVNLGSGSLSLTCLDLLSSSVNKSRISPNLHCEESNGKHIDCSFLFVCWSSWVEMADIRRRIRLPVANKCLNLCLCSAKKVL